MSTETNRPPEHGAHGEPGSGYERRDANLAALLQFGFWMAVVIVITLFGMRWTFDYFMRVQTAGVPASPFVTARQLPPSPRLQAEPHQDLKDYCEQQQREVNTYGWVDKRLRVVRIPIDRAMDLVLQNGLPIRASGPTGEAAVHVVTPRAPQGADQQGPCAYLAPNISSESAQQASER
jgi:hypothetical protein